MYSEHTASQRSTRLRARRILKSISQNKIIMNMQDLTLQTNEKLYRNRNKNRETEQSPQDNKAQEPSLTTTKPKKKEETTTAPEVLAVTTEQEEAEKLARMHIELAELQDKNKRLYAEFANFRRRTDERVEALRETASEAILIKLLPIIDDFERALATTPQSNTSVEAIQKGVRLIYDKLTYILQQEQVQPIEVIPGTQFDAELHQAIAQAPVTDDTLKGKVVEVVEKGYYYNNTVLRFTKVIIGS